jgi:D-alanyl-D-alanine carboxypeptidase
VLPTVAATTPLFSGVATNRQSTDAAVRRGLQRLVAAPGGPVGAIATLYREGHTSVITAGRANAARPGSPGLGYHMRIASISKAFSGAVALHLVLEGRLRLNDTIGARLAGMPVAWAGVTVREMLNHTSGLPDYTASEGFREHFDKHPDAYVSPAAIIGWVREDGLDFTPGSRYRYSNTDNIVVGLIAQRVTGESYANLLSTIVFRPARLTQTSFPSRRMSLPAPFIRGYDVTPARPPVDVTTLLSPSGAWASGAIVSTPTDLGAFVRADLGGRFFGPAQRREQLRFVPGSSSPAGPGTNWAGLAIFRYRTRCGTVFGHTGEFPGYVQWAAATADGRRSVTTSLNIAAPKGALLQELRSVQTAAVCALLGK